MGSWGFPSSLGFNDTKLINMETQTKKWGGKRENAGRKGKIEKKMTFGATKEVVEFFGTYEGNKNDFINKAILAYAGRKD